MKNKSVERALIFILISVLAVASLKIVSASLTVSTDKSSYTPGSVVVIKGTTSPNTAVGIQVKSPSGVTVWIDIVTSDSSGSFSSSFTLHSDAELGTYTVSASTSSEMATCTFLVQALPPPPPPPPPPKVSLISLLASNYNPKIGETINLYGEISPALSSATSVAIYIAQEGGNFSVLAVVTTDSVGRYSYSWKAEKAGVFYFKSYWKGNLTLPEAWSNVVEIKVSKLPSTITCLLSNASIVPKSSITIFGKISAQVSSTVNILYSTNGGVSWLTLASVTSSTDGSYSYVWSNVPEGSYLIKASWSGNEVYEGATSSAVVLSVVKGTTSISLQVARATITKGESIELSGSLTPSLPSITITITYAKPSGTSVTHSVTTDSNGRFSDSISTDETGNWRITASWPGNEAYEGSSATATVTVNPSLLDQILMPLIIVLILIVVLLLLIFGLLR